MSRLLITTVGTSLLTGRDTRPWAGWNRGSPLPDPATVDAWVATADPIQASAEINTLHRLDLSSDDHIHLLHSDTLEGRFCADHLAHWGQSHCGHVRSIAITGMDYRAQGFGHAGAGLKHLVKLAIESVHDAQQTFLIPLFCATGGFKAEIAFLNLLGALLGIEVVYIHDQFRELVTLPRLPLTWNVEFVREHQAFFEWIDAQPRTSIEVEQRLKPNPDLRSLIVHDDDGYAYLDAAGDLMWHAAAEAIVAAPRAVWPPADPRPPADKSGVSLVAHHRPKGWEAFVNRLCGIDCVRRVLYDTAAHGSQYIRVLDADQGDIGIVFGTTNALPLRVQTTARGQAQTELVAGYLKKLK